MGKLPNPHGQPRRYFGTVSSRRVSIRAANGPVLKVPTSCSLPGAESCGTRTEAAQNVPQAKPDLAELRTVPAGETSWTVAQLYLS